MAKNSTGAKLEFSRAIEQALSDYSELRIAIFQKRREQTLASTLAEQFVRSISLEWEFFLSRLFVLYVLESPRHYLRRLRVNVEKSVSERYGDDAKERFSFSMRKPRSIYEVVGLVDPKSFNVTAKNSSDLASKANNLLAADIARRFSLEQGDAEFFDFLVSLRNFVSHRSRSSRDTLISRIDLMSEIENDVFKLDAAAKFNFHSYLKEEPLGDLAMDRVHLLGHRVIDLSEKL